MGSILMEKKYNFRVLIITLTLLQWVHNQINYTTAQCTKICGWPPTVSIISAWRTQESDSFKRLTQKYWTVTVHQIFEIYKDKTIITIISADPTRRLNYTKNSGKRDSIWGKIFVPQTLCNFQMFLGLLPTSKRELITSCLAPLHWLPVSFWIDFEI